MERLPLSVCVNENASYHRIRPPKALCRVDRPVAPGLQLQAQDPAAQGVLAHRVDSCRERVTVLALEDRAVTSASTTKAFSVPSDWRDC